MLAIQHKLPELKTIIQILGEPPVAERRRLHRTHRKHIFSWAALIEVGQVGGPIPRDVILDRAPERRKCSRGCKPNQSLKAE